MGFVKTVTGRKKRAEALANGTALPQIVKMGFGDGGLNSDGSEKDVSTATALFNEIKQKTLTARKLNDYTYEFEAELDSSTTDADLVGKSITEACLIDADGTPVYIENFDLNLTVPSGVIWKYKHKIRIQFI